METHKLTALVASLTGQIRTATKEDEQKPEELQTTIALALKRQDPATIRNQKFTFERSDLFRLENQNRTRLTKLGKIIKEIEADKTLTNNQVVFSLKRTSCSGKGKV